ncbi:tetratricopeptide repeat protein [Lyngbya aestuarii]|uniref:tetratricopeptide repeat protein n=1 Tax=Lyngbya aestuarii TaxID=118322 RepID=UPI00403E2321
MTESPNSLFDLGLERYKAGEGPDTLVPVFQEICERSPKNPVAWSCLAWLYLLEDKSPQAYKVALKSVKLAPNAPQAQINLALAMLETGKTGVRKHIDIVKQQIAIDPELRDEVSESIEDGLSRKPQWDSLNRVKNWLFEM